MAHVFSDAVRSILGDPSLEGLTARVGSYEELHSEAQAILVPPLNSPGLTLALLQSVNKHFGITHRCGITCSAALTNMPP